MDYKFIDSPKDFFTNFVSKPISPIYDGFGDTIRFVSYMSHMANFFKQEIRISPVHNKKTPDYNNLKKMKDILSIVKKPNNGSLVLDLSKPSQIRINVLSHQYYPSRLTWSNTNSNIISYQFDGISDSNIKNCSPKEEADILEFLEDNNFTLVKLGKHLPIEKNVEHLRKSKLFIGVCSGLSHLAYMVRTPTIVIRNNKTKKQIEMMHKYNNYIDYQTVYDFIESYNSGNVSWSDVCLK